METTHQPITTQPIEQKRRRGRPRKDQTIQSTSNLPLRRRLSGRKPAPKMGLNAETIQTVTEFIQRHGGFENATALIKDLRELEISLGGLDAIDKHLEIIGLILRIDS